MVKAAAGFFHPPEKREHMLVNLRNLFRRIEVAFPVLDPVLKKRVINEGLNPYFKDNTNAWELDSHGVYQKRKARSKNSGFSAQQYLMQLLGAPPE